jgi:hypothetical protein
VIKPFSHFGFAPLCAQLRGFAAKNCQTVEATVKKSGFSFFLTGNHAKFDFLMTSPDKTQGKSLDDILRDRARHLTKRVPTDQRYLEKIGREVKGIKRIASKHAKRHR